VVAARRSFTDPEGRVWEVYELPGTGEQAPRRAAPDERRASARLYFESSRLRKALRGYPRDWAELSDAELQELCRQAKELA
jgi:hypothetical protein